MAQYVYSSPFRRAALEALRAAGQSMRIAVIGDRSREAMLVRDFDNVLLASSMTDETRRLSGCDGIFCSFADLPLVRDGASDALKAVSVTGSPSLLSADAFAAIGDICDRLELELVSHQSDPRDFGHDKETTLVFARRADRISGDPQEALKLAAFLEALSLQNLALDLLRQYNTRVAAAQQLDEALIDFTYEVEPFVAGDFTRALAGASAIHSIQATGRHRARRLSIHCDLLHHQDGEDRLRRLARGLASPHEAEIVLRVPGPRLPDFLPRLTQEITEAEIVIKAFQDPTPSGAANPCTGGFLAATGADAELLVYCDGVRELGVPGWDYDLLRAAARSEGKVFALRTGDHKTRYYTAPQDAAIAPEPVPAISRAWFEACEAWSVPGVGPGVFHALVAFYFGRADWTNKHRLLRLYPVMTVPVLSTKIGAILSGRIPPRRIRSSGIPRAAEEKAIEAALRMHAIEWCSREALRDPELVYDQRQRRLALLQGGKAQVIKSWSVEPDRTRLPL